MSQRTSKFEVFEERGGRRHRGLGLRDLVLIDMGKRALSRLGSGLFFLIGGLTTCQLDFVGGRVEKLALLNYLVESGLVSVLDRDCVNDTHNFVMCLASVWIFKTCFPVWSCRLGSGCVLRGQNSAVSKGFGLIPGWSLSWKWGNGLWRAK